MAAPTPTPKRHVVVRPTNRIFVSFFFPAPPRDRRHVRRRSRPAEMKLSSARLYGAGSTVTVRRAETRAHSHPRTCYNISQTSDGNEFYGYCYTSRTGFRKFVTRRRRTGLLPRRRYRVADTVRICTVPKATRAEDYTPYGLGPTVFASVIHLTHADAGASHIVADATAALVVEISCSVPRFVINPSTAAHTAGQGSNVCRFHLLYAGIMPTHGRQLTEDGLG